MPNLVIFLKKKGSKTKIKFRTTSKRHECEQKWTKDHADSRNTSQNLLQTHCNACIHIGVSPKVNLIDGRQKHAGKLFPADAQASDYTACSAINTIETNPITIKLKKNNKSTQGNFYQKMQNIPSLTLKKIYVLKLKCIKKQK